jgi:sugar-specific transcriptional regulator TrmB
VTNRLTAQFATNDECDVLIRLGLTLNEARVFMALYSTENSTAKAIAKVSGVAREIVYQIIPKLQKKGLVDEQVTSPKTFKAIPFEDALDTLLQQRKEEDKNLFAKAKEVAKKQQQNNTQIKIDDSQITIIAPKKDDPKWKKDWSSYKTCVDLIMPTAKFLQWPQFGIEASLDEALQKKSKIRMVTEKATKDVLEDPPIKYFTPSLAQKLRFIEYKFVDSPQIELVIFDKKVMYVSTQIEKQIKDMVWLRSNNGFLIQMANNYFECLWSNTPESAAAFAKNLPLLRTQH